MKYFDRRATTVKDLRERASEPQPSEERTKEGKGSPQSAGEMSQQELFESLDQLKNELKEFEKVREGMKTRIDSIAKLLPKLNERKELLERDIDENQKKIQQLSDKVSPLNEKVESLQRSIPQKQEQKASLEKQIQQEQEMFKEVAEQISNVANEKTNVEKTINQRQEEISEIDGQIKQINNIQQYGADLLTTLFLASKAS
jgi:chromosome segregation ATPase